MDMDSSTSNLHKFAVRSWMGRLITGTSTPSCWRDVSSKRCTIILSDFRGLLLYGSTCSFHALTDLSVRVVVIKRQYSIPSHLMVAVTILVSTDLEESSSGAKYTCCTRSTVKMPLETGNIQSGKKRSQVWQKELSTSRRSSPCKRAYQLSQDGKS